MTKRLQRWTCNPESKSRPNRQLDLFSSWDSKLCYIPFEFSFIRAIFVPEKCFREVYVIYFMTLSTNGWKDSKNGIFIFPPKKTLIWRRHCSIGKSCCSMTSKQSVVWFLEFLGREVFQPSVRLTNQKAARVCIRSINQSNRSIFVRLFLFCSRVFISRS